VFGGLLWASGAAARRLFSDDFVSAESHYVVERPHFALVLGGLLLVFGAIYFALEQLRRGRRRTLLGLGHFVATFGGVLLIFAPVFVLTLTGAPQDVATFPDAFEFWNGLSLAGYVLTLAGQLFFVAVVVDAFRREPDLG
jgi:cytochrome c oxidase subunit I